MRLFKRKEQNPWYMRDPHKLGDYTIWQSVEEARKRWDEELEGVRSDFKELEHSSKLALLQEKSAYAAELQKEKSALQSKLDSITRERDLAYVKIAELQSHQATMSSEARSIYDLKAKVDAEKIAFLTRSFEEAQRSQIVAQKEILDLRAKLETKNAPFIADYEGRIQKLESDLLLWKDRAMCYDEMRTRTKGGK